MDENIKKIDWLYLLGYFLAPAILCTFLFTVGYTFFRDGGTGLVLTTMVPAIITFAWWIFGAKLIFRAKVKAFEQAFSAAGYQRNHTFYGQGKVVILDIAKGMLGIIFIWNPFHAYILPASHVEKAWTDDGKMGSGFMEGSSMVKFCLIVDGIKVNVPTFQSNQRFRMDDKRILTGISKADMMVKSIEEAKANSEKSTKAKKA